MNISTKSGIFAFTLIYAATACIKISSCHIFLVWHLKVLTFYTTYCNGGGKILSYCCLSDNNTSNSFLLDLISIGYKAFFPAHILFSFWIWEILYCSDLCLSLLIPASWYFPTHILNILQLSIWANEPPRIKSLWSW